MAARLTSTIPWRPLVLLPAAMCTATHALAQTAPVGPPALQVAGATAPRQAWATRDGLVSLQPSVPPMSAQEVVHRLAIKDCFERWGVAYDEARLDVVRALFTADGAYQVIDGTSTPSKTLVSVSGREAIVGVVQKALAGQSDQRRHAVTNILIDKLTDRAASAIAYGVVTVAANGLSVGASVVYSADLRLEQDGQWRFTRFVIGMDHYAGRRPDVR
jgi:hypothetical protein